MQLSRRDFIATGAALAALPAFSQDDDGLVVHEWGVVSIAYGSSVWGNARSAGSKAIQGGEQPSDLPAFVETWEQSVNAQIEDWRCQPVDKPVVYFYSKKAMEVRVEVRVPVGRPKAWWPYASAFQPGFDGTPMRGCEETPEVKLTDIKPVNGRLVWEKLSLDPAIEKFPAAGGWWSTARGVGATPFSFPAEPRPLKFGSIRGKHPLGKGVEPNEKFLFYDALTPVDPGISVVWTRDGKATVTAEKHALGAVIAIRVKNGKCTAAAHGALAKAASCTLAPDAGEPALAPALVKAGLYGKEAAAVAEIWKDEFSKVDGARVLALMPLPFYNALFPIEIKPAPKELVRVLVAHLECLDPDLQAQADAWIDQFANDSIEERDAAAAKLRKLGPLVEGTIRRAAENAKDSETKARLLELLKR